MRPPFILADRAKFGPWALVTGASSGIGRAFARQLAANGLNVVLAARRVDLLDKLGSELSREFRVDHRVVAVDLSEESFIERLESDCSGLELGLIVSNAGAVALGGLLERDMDSLKKMFRLNASAHLVLARHFVPALVKRGRGGLLLVSSTAAYQGIPFVADYSAAKGFVLNLGEALHGELKGTGVHVTVLLPGATDTAMITDIGIDPASMPMKPMSTRQCVAEGLEALAANRATHIPGRMNRLMTALVPRSTAISLYGSMIEKGIKKPLTRSVR